VFKYTDSYIKTDGVKIHYYRTGGTRPPFILLHGATDNGLCWTPVAELLAEQYDVIMPDAQGHGLSDRLGRDFTFRNHIAQVGALIKELGIDKPVIMGHSMGAATVVDVAVEHPSLPKAIILEDPPWGLPEPTESENNEEQKKQAEAFRELLVGLRNQTPEEIINQQRAANPRWSEAELVPWAEAKRQFDPSLFSKPIINTRSYEELVPDIKCPALLIIGDGGIVTPEVAENAARLWKSRQPFNWVQISNAGHNIRREQFKEFCGKLFCFLQALSD